MTSFIAFIIDDGSCSTKMEGIIPWSCFSTAFQSANYQRTVGVVLGTLMTVLVLVLVADWIVVARTNNGDSSSEALQAVACLILIELHLLAIVLLYDLEYNEKEAQNHHHHHDHHHDSDSRCKNYKPPIESLQIDFDDVPTISNITTQPSEDYENSPRKHTTKTDNAAQAKQDPEKISDKTPTSTSNYSSMASISTALGSSKNSSEEGDYYDEQHRSFPCLFGFSFSYLVIFLFLHLASAALFLTSLNQQVLGMNLSLDFAPKELIRNIFLLTYGFFLASSFLSYFQRYLEHVFDISGMQNLWFKLVLSTLAALIALFVVGHAYALQTQTSLQLHPFQYSTGDNNSKPFVGEAWATGAYLIDDQATCETYDDALPINVTVAYGSEWACPNLADIQCEITVTSQVECTYLNSFLGSDQDDDAINAEEQEGGNDDNPNGLTLDDYINFRFNEYNVDDDKNEYSFEEKPSFDYWNRPSEGIIGSCTTCAAKSEHWMTERFQAYAQSNHTLYLVVGMALCFLAWPLYELWRWWAR